jgi:hypothetical protein
MEYVYLYALILGTNWDDTIIYLTEDEAITASLNHPYCRVEMFRKKLNLPGYVPMYSYYENGILYRPHG